MKLRVFIYIFIAGIMCFHFGCDKEPAGPDTNDPVYTEFIGPYLGKESPGTTPTRFASDILLSNNSWWWHDCPVFSPDGHELYFSKYINSSSPYTRIDYMVMDDENRWLSPQPAFFSSTDGDDCPRFSIDGQKLFFSTDRPGGGVYVSNKVNGEWDTPERIQIPGLASQYFTGISVARDETLYFGMATSGHNDLYVSRKVGGSYTQPESLGSIVNSSDEDWGPYIHPDEEYIIFTSNRPGGSGFHDLYISFRNPDGSWGDARNMGNAINSDNEDASPIVSHDGLYLFFITSRVGDQGYNPYWVDAGVIENLRKRIP